MAQDAAVTMDEEPVQDEGAGAAGAAGAENADADTGVEGEEAQEPAEPAAKRLRQARPPPLSVLRSCVIVNAARAGRSPAPTPGNEAGAVRGGR